MIIDGVKPNTRGLYWANVILSDRSYKLCVAELIDKENMIFSIQTNGDRIKKEPGWISIEGKPGFYKKEVYKEEINKFFQI